MPNQDPPPHPNPLTGVVKEGGKQAFPRVGKVVCTGL